MEVVVLIDYDNLTEIQKVSGMLDIATRVLMQLPINTSDDRAKCELRIYGGWYEEDRMTQLAQKLSVSIQDEFPVRIRVPIGPDKFISFPTSAELAMALAEEPSHHLFNTYQKKR